MITTHRKAGLITLLLALALQGVCFAADEPLVFDNAEHEARYQTLTEELRCLVCQNQSLADSDAELAHDLRKEIHDMLQAGKTDEEIKAFLVDRYGDFVLYRPPVQSNTLALWALPAGLLVIGSLVVLFAVRRQGRLAPDGESERKN